MTRARQSLVDLSLTPYYHVVGRCVRRAFLCGVDAYSQRDYSHRKAWVVDLLSRLAAGFAVDVAAYAVMSNHYHLVLRLNPEHAALWSEQEVARRWQCFFGQHVLVKRYLQGECKSAAEQAGAQKLLQLWRERLASLSWFMRVFDEKLARQANAEDGCSGRFWEGRFRSQALLDEVGLLACMAYVDLNPVRAGIAPTPEASEFTSIEQRIQAVMSEEQVTKAAAIKAAKKAKTQAPRPRLMPFMPEGLSKAKPSARQLPYQLQDYLELLDWAGRVQRPGKRGRIAAEAPAILLRLGLEAERFRAQLQSQYSFRGSVVGRRASAQSAAKQQGRKFYRGVLFGSAMAQPVNSVQDPPYGRLEGWNQKNKTNPPPHRRPHRPAPNSANP
ncbi:transposase [Paucibacter sp. KBW04]|uniref:transposase n=1 Tax=Paucibacter sp. KBW04 TaxID=2153361 RepID=UPI0018CC26A5